MTRLFTRRTVVYGGTSIAVCGAIGSTLTTTSANVATEKPEKDTAHIAPELGPAKAFSFEWLKEEARRRAAQPHRDGRSPFGEILQRIDYDEYQKIDPREERALIVGDTAVEFFHLGQYFQEPVRIHAVDGNQAREVIYSPDLFHIPEVHPARELSGNVGFAGFRFMEPDRDRDWLSFLGASYFRAAGPFRQYGLSARGLAIGTGGPVPEEFPRFSEFWLEKADGLAATVYAMLETPSLTGAYRIDCRRETNEAGIHKTTQDISFELFARTDVDNLGIAPFSSMYWYGETRRDRGADWRPEIHDSDGLAINTGSGERIWRPLNNPPRVVTSSFADEGPKGFGLLQRDRNFENYRDDAVFYERRASTWVEPAGDWGAGAVKLLEIPTDDEIHDNIAAYWHPGSALKAGETRAWQYRLVWVDEIDFPRNLARAIHTFSGLPGRPGQKRPKGQRKFAIEFEGEVLKNVNRDDVTLEVSTSIGTISSTFGHPVAEHPGRWRALFDVAATGEAPADIRVYLRAKEQALTETVLLQYFPEKD